MSGQSFTLLLLRFSYLQIHYGNYFILKPYFSQYPFLTPYQESYPQPPAASSINFLRNCVNGIFNIQLKGKTLLEKGFPLEPRHRGSLFPKTFKSFGKMAWKKPFFKRVSSKISARMLNLMTLPLKGESREALCGRLG